MADQQVPAAAGIRRRGGGWRGGERLPGGRGAGRRGKPQRAAQFGQRAVERPAVFVHVRRHDREAAAQLRADGVGQRGQFRARDEAAPQREDARHEHPVHAPGQVFQMGVEQLDGQAMLRFRNQFRPLERRAGGRRGKHDRHAERGEKRFPEPGLQMMGQRPRKTDGARSLRRMSAKPAST
jgi:hypothetical protein